MKNFIVYNDEGQILRTGCCMDNILELQAQDGEHVIEGECEANNHKIVNAEIVEKDENDILQEEEERLNNTPYQILRKQEYPPIEDFVDAYVKLNSGDEDIVKKGQVEMNKYIQNCLSIKDKYKKKKN